MAMTGLRCVICGSIRAPFTRVGAGCLCRQCEEDLLASTPQQYGYLLRARLIGECFFNEVQHLLRGDWH